MKKLLIFSAAAMAVVLSGSCLADADNAIDYVRKSMRDTADISATPHQGPVNTFHGYNPPACALIDYVFVKGKVKVLSHATLDDLPGGKFPSDHFPVAVTVAL